DFLDDLAVRERRTTLRELGPMVFGGVMLILAFAAAGHYMGQNAIAHSAGPEDTIPTIAPAASILTKGSLLPDSETFELLSLNDLGEVADGGHHVLASGKGDLPIEEPVAVVPASYNLAAVEEEPEIVDEAEAPRLDLSPPTSKIEKSFKLKRADRKKIIAQRRHRDAEMECLARAIYFEARSESELGQLAVAKVILNRTKNPDFPKTICGVVYQGSGSRNSCQFSFACDGLPDEVRQPKAWENSKRIAKMALDGNQSVPAVGTATNYHADYVNPKWSKSMKRLIKIGHHIFYEDS
ncbi:MAG: cell wall hydrolase, partial [Alphaproteobacteria bacterium]|nr:cell wall hydrolase [Alphaproteobacteria bacterium]